MGAKGGVEGQKRKENVKCYKCNGPIGERDACVVVEKQQSKLKRVEGFRAEPASARLPLAYFCKDCSPVILTQISALRSQPSRFTIGISNVGLLSEVLNALRLLNTRGVEHIEIEKITPTILGIIAFQGGTDTPFSYNTVTGQLVPVPKR